MRVALDLLEVGWVVVVVDLEVVVEGDYFLVRVEDVDYLEVKEVVVVDYGEASQGLNHWTTMVLPPV